MRVLICGGRKYSRWRFAFAALDQLVRDGKISTPITVIHGAARGADAIAAAWAEKHAYSIDAYPADWNNIDRPGAVIRKRSDGSKYDVLAGFVRNQLIIDVGKPDLVVAFPGNTGTADMMDRATKAAIEIIKVKS